jgi:hypothetical protein
VGAAQEPNDVPNSEGRAGNGFVVWDANGQQRASMFALVNGSLAGLNVVDANNHDRFSAYLSDQSLVNTYDATGAVTGHLP